MATETASPPDAQPVERAGAQGKGRDAARRLVDALAAKDYKGIFSSLARDVRFRYLIPAGPGHVVGAADVAATWTRKGRLPRSICCVRVSDQA